MSKAYTLLESGSGIKLEQFGNKTILRPSTVAFWKLQKSQNNLKYDASYNPKSESWEFPTQKFSDWTIELDNFKLLLSPQANGQIGFFPDHYGYMPLLEKTVRTFKNPQVLNLFAYTGMASIVSLQAGAHVTHIDISKRFLDWTSDNLKLNNINKEKVRLIPEDALLFLEREAKRQKTYQIIIADPPSFYRTGKNKIWQLEENFHKLFEAILKVLDPNSGQLFFTCHSFSLPILKNLVADYSDQGLKPESFQDLLIPEKSGKHSLPAGIFTHCKLKK